MVGRPKGATKECNEISGSEFIKIVESISLSSRKSDLDRKICLICFNYYLGMKGRDICNLKLSHIIDDDGKLLGGIILIKSNKKFSLRLNNSLMRESLQSYWDSLVSGSDKSLDMSMPLFKGQKGAYTPASLTRVINNIYKKAGYPDITTHSGKKSYINDKLRQGLSVEVLFKVTADTSLRNLKRYKTSED